MITYLITLAVLLQEAADPEITKQTLGNPKPWTASFTARLDVEYDTNVWLLDDDDQERLLVNVSGDQISGRFKHMESIEDWIVAPSVRFDERGPSPLGRKLDAYAELEWREYAVNGRRSHLCARLGADQKVGSDGRLDLDIEYIPEFFYKNLLADATDFTGSVSASERVYRAARYHEVEASLSYRHALAESADFVLDGFAAAGLRIRDYRTFDARDEFAPPVEIGVRARAWKKVMCRLSGRIERIDSPRTNEVLLLDEPSFGTDLNGDGDATDVDARSEQTVNRSRRESSLILKAEVEATESISLGFEWAHTWKDWASHEPFDVSHNGRRDDRDRLEFTAALRLGKDWELRCAWEYTIQDSDRQGDPDSTGETLDYERSVFVVSMIFRG